MSLLSDHQKACLVIQIFRFYFKCTKCSAELTIKTDPQDSDYVVELRATRKFEPWRAKDEEADKEKGKREKDEMGDAMKSLQNRTLDSKREMDILAALDEVKSMKSKLQGSPLCLAKYCHQCGELDLMTAAKMVLHDWQRGRIPFFVPPPQEEDGSQVKPNEFGGVEEKAIKDDKASIAI